MKRVIIFVMMLAAVAAQAQVRFSVGQESKAVSPDVIENAIPMGHLDSTSVWLTQVKHGWQLMSLDANLQIAGTADIEIDADRMLAATMKGNTATMLLVKNEKQTTSLLVAHLSVDGAATVDTLAKYVMPNRKDKCLVWGAKSFGGNYIGAVTVQQFRDSMEYVATAFMLSADGKTVYKREVPMTSIEQIFVTDDARIVTLATENTETGVNLMVNYVTSKHDDVSSNSINCNPMRDIRIVNVVDNRMMAIGITYARGYRSNRAVQSVVTVAFDLASASVYNYTMRTFTDEDVNILYNRYVRKKVKNHLIENLSIMGAMPIGNGGAIVLSRSFEELKNTNDGINHHIFQRMGLSVVGVNPEGEVAWVSNIRSHNLQDGSGSNLHLGITGDGNKLYIFKSESTKEPRQYEIDRTAVTHKAGKKCNLVCYTLEHNGFVEKYLLEYNSKYNFLVAAGSNEIITVRGRKLRRGVIE